MKDELIEKFCNHATTQAIIAIELLNRNFKILNRKGVKELIALYLLIPYITKDQLITKNENYKIPKLENQIDFWTFVDSDGNERKITFKNLRDSMCHSFLTIEENSGNIIIDDRATLSREEHDKLTANGCERLNIDILQKKLILIFNEIIQKQYNHIENVKRGI